MSRGSGWALVPPLVLSVVVAGFVGLVLVAGVVRGRGAFDQINFHLPTIRQFAAEWPRVDLHDYLSATAPGYHLALAALSKVGVSGLTGLRVAAAGFSVALAWLLGVMLWRRAASASQTPTDAAWRAVVCGLPVVTSMYVLIPAGWLQPDNAGWLGVLAIMALTMPAVSGDGGRGVGGVRSAGGLGIVRLGVCAVVLTALVFTRQSHIWAAALVWAGAWIGAAAVPRSGVVHVCSQPARRFGLTAVALLATLPAAAMLWWLHALWGGLTPPKFRVQHGGGFNPATPALALALVGVYSVFFAGWVGPRLLLLLARKPVLVLSVGLAGAVAALLPETTYQYEARASGLWNVVRAMEARGIIIAGRTSPLLVILAGLGAVSLAGWLGMLRPAARWYAIAGLLAFIAAQTANANAWQRYLEPMLLIALALIAAGVERIGTGNRRIDRATNAARVVGPVTLAIILLGLTYQSLQTPELWTAPVRPDALQILRDSGDIAPSP